MVIDVSLHMVTFVIYLICFLCFCLFEFHHAYLSIYMTLYLWLLKNRQIHSVCIFHAYKSLDMHFIKYLFVPYYRTMKLFQTNKAFGSEHCVAQFLCSPTSFSFCTAFDMNKFDTLITNLFTWFTLTVSFLDISLQISQTLPSIKIVLMA